MPCLNSWTFNHTPHPHPLSEFLHLQTFSTRNQLLWGVCVCVSVLNVSASGETPVVHKASWFPYQCRHLCFGLFCSFLSQWCWTLTVNMWITSAWRWEWCGRHVPLNPVSLTSSRWDIPKEFRILMWCSNYVNQFCTVLLRNSQK